MLLLHRIGFVEQQDVAVHHLGAGDRILQKGGAELPGVDQGDDQIEPQPLAQVAGHEGERHRQGVGETGGLHHDQIQGIRSLQHPMHRLLKFTVDRAADAPVAELHDRIAGGDNQLVVDAHLAELIDQYGTTQPCWLLRMWLSRVVLPAPRKPVNSVTGT